jgi:mannosyl-glycoprotein endo-beta-N-acetylglucosaminidase
MRIGRLGIYDTPVATPEPPSAVEVVAKTETTPDTATVRVAWIPSPSPVNSYNVIERHADDSTTYLGSTPNTAYFASNLVRANGESTSTIEVEAVSLEFVRSTAAVVTVTWDRLFADGFDGATAR